MSSSWSLRSLSQEKLPDEVYRAAEPSEEGAHLRTHVSPQDVQWSLEGGSASESQTFYFAMKDGGFSFIQVVHSNIGWSPSIQITLRYFSDKINKMKSINYAGSSFELSDDRRSIVIDKKNRILNTGNGFQVVVDNGYELSAHLHLEFMDQGFQVKDGKTWFGKDKSGGYVAHKYFPVAQVHGQFVVNGVPHEAIGNSLFVHAVQTARPHLLASKWDFVSLQEISSNSALILCQFETPKSYGNKQVSQGALFLNGKLHAVSVNNTAVPISTEEDTETGYLTPTEVQYTWKGRTLEEKHFSAEVNIKPRRLVAKIDVLGQLPYILRKLVQAFVAKPFVYQWVDQAHAAIDIDGRQLSMEGQAYHETTFVNQN